MPSNKVSTDKTAGGEEPAYLKEPVDDKLENGPMENRSCTDILCCMLFIVFLGGMIGVAGYSLQKGNPNLIGRGYDTDGKICGIDAGYENFPYLYFAVPKAGYLDRTVCLSECPTDAQPTQVSCKHNSKYPTSASCSNTDSQNSQIASLAQSPPGDDLYTYQTFSFLKRYCVPTLAAAAFNEATNAAGNSDTLQQWFSDVKTTWPVIAVSLGVAFVIGFIYMILMRYCSGVLTWAAILAFIIGNAVLGWRFYSKAKNTEETADTEDEANSNTVKSEKVIAYVLWGVSIVSVFAVLCLFNRIRLAIAIMKAASDYVRETLTVFLLPPFTVLVLSAFYVYWVITSLYLVSSGTPEKSSAASYVTFEYDMKLKRLLIYHLFGLLWFNAFCIAATQFVISSSVCLWYFSQGTGQGATGTIRKSIYRLVRYHLGSIAFGSLILAIIQMIRLILAYMQYQAKKLKGKDGKMIEYVLKCLQCYATCFQRFIEYLNKNAYIQIALTGKNFCAASMAAFSLIFRNSLRFGVVAGIGGIFVAFGKIFVAGITALGAFLFITKYDKYSSEVYSPFIPTLIVFIFAYAIGAIFMSVYGLAADTILACFVVDEELSAKKNAPARHCPESLKSFIDKNKKN